MSYSQHDEESHILRIVGDQPGRFLDIGAYNPTRFSNTRRLFELGWSGVMVEPAPGPFLDLLIEYGNCPRIQLACAAVGLTRGLVKFHNSEAGTATSNEPHYQKWRDTTKYEGEFYAAGITMADLIGQFGKDFDFINIDVEGGSAQLFIEALLYPRMRPKCWCVEHDGRQEEITKLAIRHGYCREHLNGENVIFAQQDGQDN